MKNINLSLALAALCASSILVNCGGGGSTSTLTPNIPNTSNENTISGHSLVDSSSIADFQGSYQYSWFLAEPDPDIGEFQRLKTYNSSLVYEHIYEENGQSHRALGVAGILADAAALPVSGEIIVEGETRFVITAPDQAADITGNSQLTLNFGAGRAQLMLNEFTQSGGNFAVDQIDIANILMNGNGLSAGDITLSYLGNAADFTALGAGYELNHQGNIFGSSSWEAGGVFLATGDDSSVIGYYIAQ